MARYGLETNLGAEAVLEKAVGFFGPPGLGLTVTERGPCSVCFVGGGGHVTITATAVERRTTVAIETQEWDEAVRRFVGKVG